MQTVKLPIFNPVYRNVDNVELQDKQSLLMNGYLSELGGTNKRPGMGVYKTLNDSDVGVDGVFWWTQRDRALAVSNGHLYDLHKIDRLVYVSDMGSSEELKIGVRPIFACYGDNVFGNAVFIANGGKILYTNPSEGYTLSELSDENAPTKVTHVAFLDNYILANSVGSNFFYWSDLQDPTTWTATNFATASGSADHVVAIHVKDREIYLFGTETLEIWENDGEHPFSRVPGGFREIGCIAPYSVISTEKGLYWLDHNRRLVNFNGSTIERVSTPYDREIEQFSTVSDCIGDKIEIDGRLFLVFNFKTEQRTLVYNVTSDNWCEWGRYDETTAKYYSWRANGYVFSPSWGVHLLADTETPQVLELSSNYYSDVTYPIRIKRTTGLIDYGTTKRKRSTEIKFRVKRGFGNSDPQLMIRWRDDNNRWSNEHWVSLGNLGEKDIVRRIFTQGIYRTRQYEFVSTSSVPVIFIDAEENIEVLDD